MSDYPWTQEDQTELTDAQAIAQAEIENDEADKIIKVALAKIEKQISGLIEQVVSMKITDDTDVLLAELNDIAATIAGVK